MPPEGPSEGKKPDSRLDRYGALALVGQLGLSIALPVVFGVVLGVYLDPMLGDTGLVMLGIILLGVAAGVYSAYRIVKPYLD